MKDYFKEMLAVVVLVAATFFVMEIPKKYYENKDEQLMGYLNQDEYNISAVEEHMDFAQKIQALSDDKCIVVEDNSDLSNHNVIDKRLYNEINEIFTPESGNYNRIMYLWGDFLKETFRNEETDIRTSCLKVIQVKDGDIYSFKSGIIKFRTYISDFDDYCVEGCLCYDMESGKILVLDVFVNWNYGEYLNGLYGHSYSALQQIYDNDANLELGETEGLFYASLEDYYDIKMNWGYSRAYITLDYLTCSPYTYESDFDSEPGTLNTIYTYIKNLNYE